MNLRLVKHKDKRGMPFRIHITSGALCLSVILLPAVFADSFGTNLTLQAALQYGATNNPQIEAIFNQWKGFEENIAVQKGLPDPKFTYGYYFESVETKVGPQNQAFGFSQTIPGFGKRAAKKAVATSQAAAAEQRYNSAKLELNANITKSYAELYYLKRSIEITKDRIHLFQDLEQVTRTRYKTGSAMGPILQAQVELGRLEDRLNSLNDLGQPQKANLNAALNRSFDSPLAWPSSMIYQPVAIDADELRTALALTSPELAELQQQIEQGNHQLTLARRERLPDFTFGVQYIETGDAATPVADSGKDPVIGTVSINLPLWFGKNRARIQSAAYRKTAAQLSLESRTQTLDAEIRQALYRLREADRKINLYKESLIPKTRQSLEVNRKGFETGQMEFINLIDTQRMLLEFELAHERALANHLIARAELSRLTGIDFLSATPQQEGTKK